MVENCIFCKINARKIPAAVVAENDQVFVIKDINPKAPLHYLIIPKKHVVDMQSLQADELPLIAEMSAMAQQLSKTDAAHHDFRIVINNGHAAGQRVFHLHMHYLAGNILPE